MNSLAAFLAMSGLAFAAAPAAAWGPIGHRVTAQIAQDNASGQTRARIEQILGHEELPEGSTWPDEQRSNPEEFWQSTAAPWHFVTLQVGDTPGELVHPPEGDAATALERFTATLRDPAASREDKALALRFVVHIITDLHMPLHVGKPGDRGGNDVKVQWFDDPVSRNLHWVWDEGMILRQQLSYSEYAERLDARMTPAQVISWWDGISTATTGRPRWSCACSRPASGRLPTSAGCSRPQSSRSGYLRTAFATASSTPLTNFASRSSKNAWATSTYSLIAVPTGMSGRASSS
jgi:hypothetical protein